MNKKIILKYIVITIVLVVIVNVFFGIIKITTNNMMEYEPETTEIQIDEKIETSTNNSEIEYMNYGNFLDDPHDSLRALLLFDDHWEELALTDNFLNKYKRPSDIIEELEYADSAFVTSYDENADVIIYPVVVDFFDGIQLDKYDFDGLIEVIRYEVKLITNEKHELEDIEILSATPYTAEGFAWREPEFKGVENKDDLYVACGVFYESWPFDMYRYHAENIEIIYNDFAREKLRYFETNTDINEGIVWAEDKKSGKIDVIVHYFHDNDINYQINFKLNEDNLLTFLEFVKK